MTHTHEDRVANRPAHLCAAYGCPLVGTSTSSTSGSDEWWCFAHYGLDYGQVQAATSEINRVSWLAEACNAVRRHAPNTPGSREAFALIQHELTLHQRKDLLPIANETRKAWLNRLEGTLLAMVREVAKPAVQLLVGEKSAKSFGKVEFDMPA